MNRGLASIIVLIVANWLLVGGVFWGCGSSGTSSTTASGDGTASTDSAVLTLSGTVSAPNVSAASSSLSLMKAAKTSTLPPITTDSTADGATVKVTLLATDGPLADSVTLGAQIGEATTGADGTFATTDVTFSDVGFEEGTASSAIVLLTALGTGEGVELMRKLSYDGVTSPSFSDMDINSTTTLTTESIAIPQGITDFEEITSEQAAALSDLDLDCSTSAQQAVIKSASSTDSVGVGSDMNTMNSTLTGIMAANFDPTTLDLSNIHEVLYSLGTGSIDSSTLSNIIIPALNDGGVPDAFTDNLITSYTDAADTYSTLASTLTDELAGSDGVGNTESVNESTSANESTATTTCESLSTSENVSGAFANMMLQMPDITSFKKAFLTGDKDIDRKFFKATMGVATTCTDASKCSYLTEGGGSATVAALKAMRDKLPTTGLDSTAIDNLIHTASACVTGTGIQTSGEWDSEIMANCGAGVGLAVMNGSSGDTLNFDSMKNDNAAYVANYFVKQDIDAKLFVNQTADTKKFFNGIIDKGATGATTPPAQIAGYTAVTGSQTSTPTSTPTATPTSTPTATPTFLTPGASCTPGVAPLCQSGSSCVGGTCKITLSDGAACIAGSSATSVCQLGSSCINSICQPPPPPIAAGTISLTVVSGSCGFNNGTQTALVAAAAPAPAGTFSTNKGLRFDPVPQGSAATLCKVRTGIVLGNSAGNLCDTCTLSAAPGNAAKFQVQATNCGACTGFTATQL